METTQKSRILFLARSFGLGLVSYALATLLFVFVFFGLIGDSHPHSMEGILYILFPMIMAPVGGAVGLVAGWFFRHEKKFAPVGKVLLAGMLIALGGFLFFAF